MVTWSTFIAQLPSSIQQVAQAVRNELAAYGIPLTFPQFLRAAPNLPANAGTESEAVQSAWQNLFIEKREGAEDADSFVAGFELPERELAQTLLPLLEQEGLDYGIFHSGERDGDLPEILTRHWAALWGPTIAALQQRGQRVLDEQERLTAFYDSLSEGLREAYVPFVQSLTESNAFISLVGIAQLPLNQLARDLTPAIVSGNFLKDALQQLAMLARRVLEANYQDADAVNNFLTQSGFEQAGVKALLQILAPDQPLEAIELLANNSETPGELVNQVGPALKSNNPFVYAVAAAFQQRVAQFLASEATTDPPADMPAATALIAGRLLGQNAQPLANLGLQITQLLPLGQELALGELYTSADGSFTLRLRQAYEIDAEGTIVAQPFRVRIDAFALGQPFDAEPAFTKIYTPADVVAGLLVVSTELSTELPTPASYSLNYVLDNSEVAISSSPELTQYLVDKDIESLADIRRVGGLLAQEDLPADADVRGPAAKLDAHAQFELLSKDIGFVARVINEGDFYSPLQVAKDSTRAEFVQLLGTTDDVERLQAATFYEQAVTVSVVLQALDLAQKGINIATPVGPLTQPLTSYDPGVDSPTTLLYSAEDQCDCLACQSAVSPTAYLAALLDYAATNLRQNDLINVQGKGIPTGTGSQGIESYSIDARQLQELFLQPFCDLPINCQFAEQTVCRYRLTVEVLREHLQKESASSAPVLTAAIARPYLRDVYQRLMQGIGTSPYELEQTADKAALARTLRIFPYTIPKLRALFIDVPDTRPLAEHEAKLEEYFGLPSTSPSRHPLSTGVILTQPNPFARLTFQNLQWGVNVASDGQVSAQILLNPGKPPKLLIYRQGFSSLDEVVATGILVADSTNATTFQAVLYPQHGSGLKGSAVVRGPLAAGTYEVAVIPTITADRLANLELDWQKQDLDDHFLLFDSNSPIPGVARTVSWNGYAFLLDPDVIGPDDLRPGAAGQSATAGWAYKIWVQRLNFLQAQFAASTQTLDTLIGQLLSANQIAYSTVRGAVKSPARASTWVVPATPAYANRNGIAVLEALETELRSESVGRVREAQKVLTAWGLSGPAFERLAELRTKAVLTEAEKEEGRQILRQSLKKAFEDIWAEEEADPDPTKNIVLNGNWFQYAIHEPIEGNWLDSASSTGVLIPVSGIQVPVIDPQLVSPLELPDPGIGDTAATLWRERAIILKTVRESILETGRDLKAVDRANAMLQYAYSKNLKQPVTEQNLKKPYLDQPPYATLEELSVAYQTLDEPTKKAVPYVRDTLGLTLEELNRLIELRTQVAALPSEALWQEMAATLITGWKRATVYSGKDFVTPDGETRTTWKSPVVGDAATNSDNIAGRLVLTRKQKLAKWRASSTSRAAWVAALDQAFTRPVIDPDQLVPGDFHQAGRKLLTPVANKVYANPAFDLYVERDKELNAASGLYFRTGTAWADSGVRLGITSVLKASADELRELYARYLNQGNIAPELKRLNLSVAGLELVVNHGTRPEELRHLLVQVQRERRYADWSREEVALGLYQSPRYFRPITRDEAALPGKPWRYSARARREWQQDLSARYDQADATAGALRQLIRQVEEQSLPLLRDILADQVVMSSTTIPAYPLPRPDKLQKLGERYLLDFSVACCQYTTRVGQAIEVLQKLFLNQQHQLPTAGASLSLATANTTFSQEWQWLQSYEKWRSLMFLYLYPQNILFPSLKPNNTTQLQHIIRDIRQGVGLRPGDACRYVEEYEKYLSDIASLEFADAIQSYVEVQREGCKISATEKRRISVQAGLSASGKAYTNLHYIVAEMTPNPAVPPVWNIVPGALDVQRIIGIAAYANSANERHIYLFAFLQPNKENKPSSTADGLSLGYQRFNLSTFAWEEDYSLLEISGEGVIDVESARVSGAAEENWPPIVIGLRNRRKSSIYDYPFNLERTASRDGKDFLEYFRYRPNNIDLFAISLNSSGRAIGNQTVKRILFVEIFKVASVIRVSEDEVLLLVNASEEGRRGITVAGISVSSVVESTHSIKYFSVHITETETQAKTDLVHTESQRNLLYHLYNTNIANSQSLLNGADIRNSLNTYFSKQKYKLISHFTQTGNSNKVDIEFAYDPSNTFSMVLESGNQTSTRVFKLYLIRVGVVAGGTHSVDTATFYLPTGPDPVPFLGAGRIIIPQTASFTYVGPLWQPRLSVTDTNSPSALVQHTITPLADGAKPELTIKQGTAPRRFLYQRLPVLPPLLTVPKGNALFLRRFKLNELLPGNTVNNNSLLSHLVSEAYFALPLLLATELEKGKYYDEALDYYRLIYDYTKASGNSAPAIRLIYPGLTNAANATTSISRWLANPDNPFTIAGLRKDSQLQFVVMSLVRCLLAYADAEFARDNVESVSRARSLYELAAKLIKKEILQHDVQDCYSILNQVDVLVEASWQAEWEAMKAVLASANQRTAIEQVLQYSIVEGSANRGIIWLFTQAQNKNGIWRDRFDQAWKLVDSRLTSLQGRSETLCGTRRSATGGRNAPAPTGGLVADGIALDEMLRAASLQTADLFTEAVNRVQLESGAVGNQWLNDEVVSVNDPITNPTNQLIYPVQLQLSLSTNRLRPYVPFLSVAFCVPTNPVPYALQLHAALNLYKIRTCRNIAGIERELDPYAAPTDTTTGLPTIGLNGQLTQAGRLVIPATQYRYAYIVERTRQLVSLAQQAEAALLGALEKRDAEAYSLLRARQDISVNRASVQLQSLRITEAQDGIGLAELQLARSQTMRDQYNDWLNDGLNRWEHALLIAIVVSGAAKTAAALTGSLNAFALFTSVGTSIVTGALNAVAAAADATAQFSQNQASFARRRQEWNFQRNLADNDIQIGNQQIRLSKDRLRIVGQEKQISELQLSHAENVLNFLTTKFTNAELYDWMSQILETAYSYFLQQATATAKLAELQLAFERQEAPVNLIQENYWLPPTDNTALADTLATTGAVDRKGLTGSVRLLRDVTRLDQYAFETNRRKLQLTKTISLAQSFPTEFVRFRETGVLAFACPQAWFDQDFPGHYLRIIRRVRTSVIALVPPVDGIKARLVTAGLSRVTVAGTPFQTLTLPRPPEGVSLTSPQNATGLFELEQQPNEFLYPFEGLGVDVPWTFSLQKAANTNLDYESIADVLITIEYTALHDADFARQLLPALAGPRTEVVALSFRNRFADQWYDLHHAADLAPDDQYVARIQITAADLPSNLGDLQLRNISLYIEAPLDAEFTDRSQFSIGLSRTIGNRTSPTATARANSYGLVSTKTGLGLGRLYDGNAAALVPLLRDSPTGDWTLTVGTAGLNDALRQRLLASKVTDIYLILEVEGEAPAYTLV